MAEPQVHPAPDRSAFPDGFWWGTGNSSNQCEGAAATSTWRTWERAGRVPLSGDGNGFARCYADDFTRLSELGLDHFRLSIEWARLEPTPGVRDQGEIERYRNLLHAGTEAGLKMWITAHHFTLPQWFADMGGFGDEHARSYHWRRHVEFLAETFGELVFGWKPINEPHAFALCGWLLGVHPPGHTDVGEAARMLVATHLANHEAWMALRGGSQPVATIHNLSPAMPLSDSDDDRHAARFVDALSFDMWIDMQREGILRLPKLPGHEGMEAIEDPGFIDSFDVIGFSYYNATGVRSEPALAELGGVLPCPFPVDGEVGPLGYVPWSEGLGMVLERLHRDLPAKPLLVSEYGIGTDNDAQRSRYLADGLGIVANALGAGIDVRGFFHWTAVDNYEWEHGYGVPFGLFDRDRNRRPSADVIATCASGPGH